MNVTSSDEIKAFWDWFVRRAPALKAIRSAEDAAYAELETRVAKIDPRLDVEIGGSYGSDEMSLVITAHADARLFPVVDSLVQSAPSIDGWRILALKPPLFEDLEVTYDGGAIRSGDIWFRVLGERGLPGRHTIEVACADFERDCIENAALLALESLLGERAFATSIEVARFVALPSNPVASGFAPIDRLPALLGIIQGSSDLLAPR